MHYVNRHTEIINREDFERSPSQTPNELSEETPPYESGTGVYHQKYGKGQILRHRGDTFEVNYWNYMGGLTIRYDRYKSYNDNGIEFIRAPKPRIVKETSKINYTETENIDIPDYHDYLYDSEDRSIDYEPEYDDGY